MQKEKKDWKDSLAQKERKKEFVKIQINKKVIKINNIHCGKVSALRTINLYFYRFNYVIDMVLILNTLNYIVDR